MLSGRIILTAMVVTMSVYGADSAPTARDLLTAAQNTSASDPVKAIDLYERYLSRNYDDPAAHVALADLHRRNGDKAQAFAHYNTAIRQLDQSVPSKKPDVLRARSLAGLGKTDEAILAYEKAIMNRPRDGEAWCDYAEMLINQRKYTDAENLLHRAPRKGEYFVRTFSLWSVSLERRGKVKEAADLLRLVLKLYPETTKERMRLAHLLETLQDRRGALEQYQIVARTGNEGPDGKRATAAVTRLSRDLDRHVALILNDVRSEDDRNRLARFEFRSGLGRRADFGIAAHHRDIEGVGFLGYRNVEDRSVGGDFWLSLQYGDGVRYLFGGHLDNGGDDVIAGARFKTTYSRETWETGVELEWQKALFDPVALEPHDGASDGLYWRTKWSPVDTFRVELEVDSVYQYLLNAPAGLSDDFFKYTLAHFKSEYCIGVVPGVWVYYEYKWLSGIEDDDYAGLMGIAQKYRVNAGGIRFEHNLGLGISMTASYTVGKDDARYMDFGDYEIWSVGVVWRPSERLDFTATYIDSTETLTGAMGDYSKAEFKAVGRF